MDSPPDAIDRRFQPARFDRLEQIVDGVHLECLDRVLVVGRHEDDLGVAASAEQTPGDFETGQPGHLHVEHHQVRRFLLDHAEGFEAVRGLRHDFDRAYLSQEKAQFFTRQLLVVHDNSPDRLLRFHIRR